MAIMLSALYRALLDAHVPEDSARRAAEELAGYESRFTALERDLTLLKWMVVGTNVALLFVLGKLFMK